MSRGYGRVQRAVLEALRDHEHQPSNYAVMGLSTADLARRVYHNGDRRPPTPAETAAVSRALAGLKLDGLVRVTYSGEGAFGVFKYGSRWKLAKLT